MDPLQQLSPPGVHGEIVAGRSASVRKQLIILVDDIKKRTFDLMDLLLEADAGHYWLQWGFDSLSSFGASELGLKPRKVQYMLRIGEVCKAVGLARTEYELIGIAKLRDICSLNPESSYFNPETKENEPLADHIVRLVRIADVMTGPQVEDEVRRLKGQTGENAQVVRSYSCTKSTWENVINPAYELARKRLGSAPGRDAEDKAKDYSDGVCQEVICAEFIADPANAEPELETEDNASV